MGSDAAQRYMSPNATKMDTYTKNRPAKCAHANLRFEWRQQLNLRLPLHDFGWTKPRVKTQIFLWRGAPNYAPQKLVKLKQFLICKQTSGFFLRILGISLQLNWHGAHFWQGFGFALYDFCSFPYSGISWVNSWRKQQLRQRSQRYQIINNTNQKYQEMPLSNIGFVK